MPDGLKAKAAQVYDLLIERYGAQPLVPRRQPMHELISTIPTSNWVTSGIDLYIGEVER